MLGIKAALESSPILLTIELQVESLAHATRVDRICNSSALRLISGDRI